MPRNQNRSDDDDDLLWGVSAIGRHIRRPKRQTQYLIDKKRIPVKRLGRSSDVARAVMFFADRDNGFVTGQTLYVCGGSSVGTVVI